LRLGKGWKEELSPMRIAEDYVLQYHGIQSLANFAVTVVHEGSEGEVFWKWFRMQVSFISSMINFHTCNVFIDTTLSL